MSVIRWRDSARIARYSTALILTAGALHLSACHDSASTSADARAALDDIPEPVAAFPASVSVLNYTPHYIPRVLIIDADGKVGGGPNVGPAYGTGKPAGGGAESCCVIVPDKWQKDMTVTVRWSSERIADGKTPGTWYSAKAKVPPYTSLTHAFWVRFLPNDRIVVQVNDQEWYIPKPVENESAYIVQGVLDQQLNKEMHQ